MTSHSANVTVTGEMGLLRTSTIQQEDTANTHSENKEVELNIHLVNTGIPSN